MEIIKININVLIIFNNNIPSLSDPIMNCKIPDKKHNNTA